MFFTWHNHMCVFVDVVSVSCCIKKPVTPFVCLKSRTASCTQPFPTTFRTMTTIILRICLVAKTRQSFLTRDSSVPLDQGSESAFLAEPPSQESSRPFMVLYFLIIRLSTTQNMMDYRGDQTRALNGVLKKKRKKATTLPRGRHSRWRWRARWAWPAPVPAEG